MDQKPKSAYQTYLKAFSEGLKEFFFDEDGNFEEEQFKSIMDFIANDEYMLALAEDDRKRGALP